LSNASSTYLKLSDAASTYLTQTSAATIYATNVSPTFSGTVTLPNDIITNQNSAAFLTSVPNNYLTATTSISQSEINEANSGCISTAIISTATSAAACAVANALYTTDGALVYATKVELALTDTSEVNLSNRSTSDYYTAAQTENRYLGPLDKYYTFG
jgi:hypothetical protein